MTAEKFRLVLSEYVILGTFVATAIGQCITTTGCVALRADLGTTIDAPRIAFDDVAKGALVGVALGQSIAARHRVFVGAIGFSTEDAGCILCKGETAGALVCAALCQFLTAIVLIHVPTRMGSTISVRSVPSGCITTGTLVGATHCPAVATSICVFLCAVLVIAVYPHGVSLLDEGIRTHVRVTRRQCIATNVFVTSWANLRPGAEDVRRIFLGLVTTWAVKGAAVC